MVLRSLVLLGSLVLSSLDATPRLDEVLGTFTDADGHRLEVHLSSGRRADGGLAAARLANGTVALHASAGPQASPIRVADLGASRPRSRRAASPPASRSGSISRHRRQRRPPARRARRASRS